MIEYEYFESVLTELKAASDFKNDVRDAITKLRKKNIRNLPIDFMGEETIIIAHDCLVVNLLAKLFAGDDKRLEDVIDEIIGWYIWDTEWGTDEGHNEVEYPDKTKKRIVTFKDCYDDVIYTINNWSN